jgi:L-threonylcarbamoyladenylate synthase
MITKLNDVTQAYPFIQDGKIIAYPTEAVYGLGCDPFNQVAVSLLLGLKQRPADKGLILLIADWVQLEPLIQPISDAFLAPVKATWPGSVTWVFPKSHLVPSWLSGGRDTIAIRMSAHPIAHALAKHGPIVSTSANFSGEPSVTSIEALEAQFPLGIDAVICGALGGEKQPSRIFDLLSGQQLR